jgi:DNA polymerase-1
MIRLPGALTQAGMGASLLLQVHDELVLELPAGAIRETARLVQQVMEGAYPLSIPLLTDAKVGTHWGNLKPLDTI